MLQPKKNNSGLNDDDHAILVKELTNYANDGASDEDLKVFRDTFIAQKKKSASSSQKPNSESSGTAVSSGTSQDNRPLNSPSKYPVGSMAWNQEKLKQNVKGYTSIYDKFKEVENVAPEKIDEIKQSVDAEINNEGVMNKIATVGRSALNYFTKGAFSDGDALYNEKVEAKKQLAKEAAIAKSKKQPAPEITPETITEKAKQIAIDKRIKSQRESQVRDFVSDLPDGDKNNLTRFSIGELSTIKEDQKVILKKQNVLNDEIDYSLTKIQELNTKAKSLKAKGEELPDDLQKEFQVEHGKYQSLLGDAIKNQNEFISKEGDIGDFTDNIDVFKRNYGALNNVFTNIHATAQELSAGVVGAFDYGLQVKSKFLGANETDMVLSDFIGDVSYALNKSAENKRKGIEKSVTVENINTAHDFGHWLFSDVIANQVPVYALIATGYGGIGAIGASSLGNKYEQMVEEMNPRDPKPGQILMNYSDSELLSVPLGYGIAETASAMVDGMILRNAGRVINSATSAERKTMAQGLWSAVKQSSKGAAIEGLDESATQVAENLLDRYSGKKVALLNGVKDAGSAGAIMGAFLPISSHVVSVGLKPFLTTNNIQKATAEIANYEKQLQNTEISETSRKVIEKQLEAAKAKLNTELSKKIKDVKKLSDSQFTEIGKIQKEKAAIKSDAKEIALDDNLDDDTKDQLTKSLKSEYNEREQRRVDILERSGYKEFNKLDDEQQIKLKDQAARQLMKEENPDGKKNIEITNEQIVERANKIYKAEQENLIKEKDAKVEIPITETEVKTEVQEPTVADEEKVTFAEQPVQEQVQYERNMETGEMTQVEDVVAPSIEGKDKVKEHISTLANDNYLFTHVTTEDNARNITENGMSVSLGTGISSTLTASGQESATNQAERLMNGEVVHRDLNNNSVAIISVPKAELDKMSGKSLAEKFENWLVENNHINDKGELAIPKELNAGYLSGQNFITNEKSSKSNTSTDGNIQPRVEPMGESGTAVEDSTGKETLPESVDGGAIEEKAKFALDNIEKGVTLWSGNISDPRVDLGIAWTDIRKGELDIKNGKYNTVPAKRLIEAMDKAKSDGGFRYKEGTGGKSARNTQFVPLEEMQKMSNEYSLTDAELEEINQNEEQLSIEADNYFNSLDNESQTEILEYYEQGNDESGEVGEDTEVGKGEISVSNQEEAKPESRKEKRIKATEAKIDDLANALKDLLPSIPNTSGLKKQGLSQDQIIDFIADSAKMLASATITIDEAIRQVVEHLKSKGFDVDVDLEKVKSAVAEKDDIETIGLTKKDVESLRDELGEEQFSYEVKGNAERIREAKSLIEKGYNIANLVKKLSGESNYLPTGTEVEIIKQYYASLTESINSNPTPELLKERTELLKTIDATKVEQGRSVQAWDGLTGLEDNLANFLTEESQFVDLDKQQIAELTEKWQKAQSALEQLQAKQQEAFEEAKNKKALTEIEKAKLEAKKTGNKSLVAEAFKRERKEAFNAALEALKKTNKQFNMAVVPYQAQLIAIAPHVKTIMKSYVNEGIYNLEEIVQNIYEEFAPHINGLKDKDIRDIIAGQYNDTKQTRSAKLSKIRDIEVQARLEQKLEDLQNGKPVEKNPVAAKKQNAQIESLKEQIKEIKKRNPELVYDSKITTKKNFYRAQIEKLKEDIRKGNYEEVEPPLPILLDNEALKLKDEYIKFKEETRERRQQQERAAMSKAQKALYRLQELAATKRLVQTSIDLSIPLRQGTSVMLNYRTLKTGLKAYGQMLSSVKSQMNFKRMMFDIEQQPQYLESKEDGVVYQVVGALSAEMRDEFHQDHFLYRAPVLGRLLKGSEVAAAAWTNYARFELYLRGMKQLEAQGKTRQNAKQAYEDMSARVMVSTGRGKLPGISDKEISPEASFIKKALGNTLYGSRLVSATFRKLNPAYYLNPNVDKTVRIEALKDMAGYVSGLVAISSAFIPFGFTISFDWDDPDFLKLRKGDSVIDITGGQATYVRTFMRIVSAAYKQADPDVAEDDAKKYAKFAGNSITSFWRNKLAPNTSYAVNAFYGENTLGQDFDPYEIVKIYPMYTDDIKEALEEGSPMDIAVIVPISVLGLGYQNYPDRINSDMGEVENQKLTKLTNLTKRYVDMKDGFAKRKLKKEIDKLTSDISNQVIKKPASN